MRKRSVIAAAALAALTLGLAVPAPAAGSELPRFRSSIQKISPKLAKRMTGVSWRPGCPVPLGQLRLVEVTRLGFDGKAKVGRLVVHRKHAKDIRRVMRTLYEARFPIHRMRLIDAYGGSDFASIEADNTSAFNCRYVDGTTRWSEHAYGRAIDVNPIENPFVTSSGTVAHAKSRGYVDRSRARKGMIGTGDVVVGAFDSIGWSWGGYWSPYRDYQHFSASGG